MRRWGCCGRLRRGVGGRGPGCGWTVVIVGGVVPRVRSVCAPGMWVVATMCAVGCSVTGVAVHDVPAHGHQPGMLMVCCQLCLNSACSSRRMTVQLRPLTAPPQLRGAQGCSLRGRRVPLRRARRPIEPVRPPGPVVGHLPSPCIVLARCLAAHPRRERHSAAPQPSAMCRVAESTAGELPPSRAASVHFTRARIADACFGARGQVGTRGEPCTLPTAYLGLRWPVADLLQAPLVAVSSLQSINGQTARYRGRREEPEPF